MASSVQLTAEELCDSLDRLCIQQLELMDQLIKGNMMLEENMRGGYYFLGKTRYSMGVNAVSALQLPTRDWEVGRLAEVVSAPMVPEGDVMYHRVDARFSNPASPGDKETDSTEENGLHSDSCPHQGLRRRFSCGGGEQRMEEDDGNICSKDASGGREHKPKVVLNDPLRWFTALPPQTLRQAQAEFKKSVCLVAQCTTTQLKLKAVNKELSRLYEIKRKLDRIEKEA